MTLLLVYLFVALSVSFLCSILEAVLLTTPVSYLNVKQGEGEKSATLFLKYKSSIDRPLAAILTLNTFAHTIGAAGVGAQANVVFGEAYFGYVSAVLTILILVFSEIFPKSIGANYWRTIALPSAVVIRSMIVITYPFVIVSEFMTKLFARKIKENTVSREEISAMATIGVHEGVFQENENRIIQNLIKLKLLKIQDIMTPRVVVVVANENMQLRDFIANKEFLHFSRIPVYTEHKDQVTGYVLRSEVFEALATDERNQVLLLKDIKRNIVSVHAVQPAFEVWDFLLDKKEHLALVVDEYGGMDGIITMEDIIETLIGIEIVDEKDHVIDMQQLAKERWEKRKIKYQAMSEEVLKGKL